MDWALNMACALNMNWALNMDWAWNMDWALNGPSDEAVNETDKEQ
jgi:hypothetical protein